MGGDFKTFKFLCIFHFKFNNYITWRIQVEVARQVGSVQRWRVVVASRDPVTYWLSSYSYWSHRMAPSCGNVAVLLNTISWLFGLLNYNLPLVCSWWNHYCIYDKKKRLKFTLWATISLYLCFRLEASIGKWQDGLVCVLTSAEEVEETRQKDDWPVSKQLPMLMLCSNS